jgi:hypothetical protein
VSLRESQDEITDPLLAAIMDDVRRESHPEVDWERLHGAITSSAALPLARRRSRQRSFASRSFMPIAVAASVAFMLFIGPSVYEGVFEAPPAVEFATNVDEDVLMHALMGDLSEQELLRLVNGSPETLLAVAIGSR